MTTQMNLTGLKPSSLETGKVIQITYLGHKDSHREFLLHLQALVGRIQRAAVQYSTTTTSSSSFSNGGTGSGGRFISAQAQAWTLPRDGRQAREALLKIEFSTGSAANKAQSLFVANQVCLPVNIVVTSLERLSYFVLEEGDILLSLNLRGIGQQQMNLDDFSGPDGVSLPTRYAYSHSQPRSTSHSFDFGSPYGSDLAPLASTPISSPPVAPDNDSLGAQTVFHLRGPSFGSEDGHSSTGSLSSHRDGYGTTMTTRTTPTMIMTTRSPSVDGYSDADLESPNGSMKNATMNRKLMVVPDAAIRLPSNSSDRFDEFDQLALSMANLGVATPIVERTNAASVPWYHREKTIVAVAPIKKDEAEMAKLISVSDATSYHQSHSRRMQPNANTPPQVLYSHVASNRTISSHSHPPTSPPAVSAPRHAVTSSMSTMSTASDMRAPRSSISSESSSGSGSSVCSGSDGHSTSNHSHNDHSHNEQQKRTHRPRQDKRLYSADPHQGPRPTDWMLSEETLKSRATRDAKFAQVVAMGLTKGRTKAQWAQARRPGKRDRDAAKAKLREMEEAQERERLQALLEESRH